MINRDKYLSEIVNVDKEKCLKIKTIGPRAWRSSGAFTLASKSCDRVKYNINTVLCQKKYCPLQEQQQRERKLVKVVELEIRLLAVQDSSIGGLVTHSLIK